MSEETAGEKTYAPTEKRLIDAAKKGEATQKLRVVVMGFHQPRQLWTPKQFFQWLLREPDYEHRVVYAEFQHPFFGAGRAEAEDKALELLTKVDFDQSAAEVFLGDRTGLGSDVLGGYAKDIIKSWGPSTFLD
mgnify:CR=1 FL=1